MKQINIEVMGRDLSLTAPASEESSLRQAVALLNDKITTVVAQKTVLETDKIIILAALNIIHDFLRMKDENGLDLTIFESKIEDMLLLCKKAMQI